METDNVSYEEEIPKDELDSAPHHLSWDVQSQQASSQIVGVVTSFISQSQKLSRELSPYQINSVEHPQWQPVACYFRNKISNNNNTRTHQTLIDCLQFLLKEFLPLIEQSFADISVRKKLLEFLHVRILAIRNQYYVQKIFDPRQLQKIIRILIWLETLLEKPLRIAGLEEFLNPANKQLLMSTEQNIQAYQNILEIAICWANSYELSNILTNHFDVIENSEKLMKILEINKKILDCNYFIYFKSLASHKIDVICRFVLWSKVEVMRKIYVDRVIAANMNEELEFICKIMGLKKKVGRVNLKQEKKKDKLNIFKELQGNFDLPMKLWINEKAILGVCQFMVNAKNQ